MIETEFDPPDDRETSCGFCHKPMISKAIWTGRVWIYPNCHSECYEKSYTQPQVKNRRVIPERVRGFEEFRFKSKEALRKAETFKPGQKCRTLAMVGDEGTGKSHLMWHTIERFFQEYEKTTGKLRWVNHWLFPDLVTEWERNELTKIKNCEFCFLEDIGVTKAFGREEAQLQGIIRTRIQKGYWTFLTIVDPRFDPGLEGLFRTERVIQIDLE